MKHDDERLTAAAGQRRGPGLLARLLSSVLAAVLLVLALMFSAVLFAALALAGVLVVAWFWWKTRALRRQMASMADEARRFETDREFTAARTATEGEIIEGEVIRVSEDAPELPRRHGMP